MSAPIVVVMGVCGCGKSSVGARLATALGVDFLEGDDLHPPRNVELMRSGTPLTDEDRRSWLQELSSRLAQAQSANRGLVLACSALKRSYRDTLRSGAPGLQLVYLHGSQDMLAARLLGRSGHYMPASLLDSQLAVLEPPGVDEGAWSAGIDRPVDDIVAQLVPQISRTMATFTKITLATGADGRAYFHESAVTLDQGKPQALLSALMPSGGLQLRMSPVGFRSSFHCTETPQWVFILGGQMEIGLQDGSSRVFGPGQHFYSDDRLPAGATFDAAIHGHWSRQLGPDPLVTVFVRG